MLILFFQSKLFLKGEELVNSGPLSHKNRTEVVTLPVTLLIINQIRSSLGGSEGNVGAFEEHKH